MQNVGRVVYGEIRLIDIFEDNTKTWLLKLSYHKKHSRVIKRQNIVKILLRFKPQCKFMAFNNCADKNYITIMIAFNTVSNVAYNMLREIHIYFRKLGFELIS